MNWESYQKTSGVPKSSNKDFTEFLRGFSEAIKTLWYLGE
jgi:hypothetical protein